MLNEHNEKLIALNFERIQWWLGEGVEVSNSAAYILGRLRRVLHGFFLLWQINCIIVCVFYLKGLSGILPITHTIYMAAWRNRKRAAKEAAAIQAQEAASKENVSS